MANTVYDSETISLQDGTEVTLVPLAIGRLRRFMKAWQEFSNIESEEQAFDIYINCCGISLEKSVPEKVGEASAEETITKEYREYLEDVLDMDTIWKILEICGGMSKPDPKAIEAAQTAAMEKALAGTA